MRCATRRMNRYCHSHANHFSIDGFVSMEERWKAVLCVCMLEAREKLLKRFPWTQPGSVHQTCSDMFFKTICRQKVSNYVPLELVFVWFSIGQRRRLSNRVKKPFNTCAWLTFIVAMAHESLLHHKSRFEVKLFDWSETYLKEKIFCKLSKKKYLFFSEKSVRSEPNPDVPHRTRSHHFPQI